MSDRRTFLRGLASLPLIGGSVAILGQPSAAAVPVTDALHARYLAWLAHEHWAALREHEWRQCVALWRPDPDNYEPTAEARAARAMRHHKVPSWWLPNAPDVAEVVTAGASSTRAAVILSAAGVPIGGRHG